MTYQFIYSQFPTHVPITRNKFKANKYIKINGQSLYNGKLKYFQRDIAVSWLHDYLATNTTFEQIDSTGLVYPLQLTLDLHVPLNYGTIRMIKNKLVWKPAKEDYKPNWDIDNQWLWNKLFCDVLQINKVVPNDNVSYINAVGPIHFVETSDFDDRKLVFTIISKTK